MLVERSGPVGRPIKRTRLGRQTNIMDMLQLIRCLALRCFDCAILCTFQTTRVIEKTRSRLFHEKPFPVKPPQ